MRKPSETFYTLNIIVLNPPNLNPIHSRYTQKKKMTNREKYKFDDFTLGNYDHLLDIALMNGYTFSDYDLHHNGPDYQIREIIWRHDVEFSVHIALKMAQIEHDKKIKAHYFFQIHSEFYNIFEKEIFLLVKKILDLGHLMCLHFA